VLEISLRVLSLLIEIETKYILLPKFEFVQDVNWAALSRPQYPFGIVFNSRVEEVRSDSLCRIADVVP